MAKKNTSAVEETTIDKKKIEKELKKELKDDLLSDLEKQVDGLIQAKIDKFEKKINKQKQRALLKKNIIIILLLAIVIFEGKILYDNGLLNNSSYKFNNNSSYNKDNNNNNIDNKPTKEEDIKDNEWYIKKYSYLLDNIKTDLTIDKLTYLYKKDYTAKNIDNKVRLNMAYQLLEKESIVKSEGFLTIDATDLENAYKTIFGKDLEFKNEDFANNCINFIFNESLNKYLAIDLKCEVNTSEIERQIISITEKDNKVLITTVIGIYDSKEKTISNIDGTFNIKYNDDIKKYEDKLDKFTFEFIKDGENYYFNSIEKVK